MKKMNPEIKKLWVEALRSGAYNQGKNRLRNLNNEFCCLGVLCDLHAKAHGNDWTYEDGQIRYVTYLTQGSALPQPVTNWAGISLYGHYDGDEGNFNSLTRLNDIFGFTFNEIADVIEREF